MSKRITIATIKSFIRKNNGSLFIDVKSKFDGMVDGCVSQNDGFQEAKETASCVDYTFGISGAWFVGGSRDYLTAYEDETYTGFSVSNACGRFTLAIKK